MKKVNAVPRTAACLRLLIALLAFTAALLSGLAGARSETETPPPQAGSEPDMLIAEEIEKLLKNTDLTSWQTYFDAARGLSPGMIGHDTVESLVRALAEKTETGGTGTDDTEERSASADEKEAERAGSLAGIVTELLLPGLRTAGAKLMTASACAVLTCVCSVVFAENGVKKPLVFILLASSMLPMTALLADMAAVCAKFCGDIAEFACVCAPVLASLLSAMGCSAQAGLLSPKLALIADGVSVLVKGVILPLVTAGGVIAVMGVLTDEIKLDRLRTLIGRAVKWLIAVASVLYTGTAAVSGISAAAADGISIRTARLALDRLIPSAGSLVNGAADAVRAGALIFKNAAGTAALMILAGIAVRPLVGIASGTLALRLCAAAIEPFADERLPKLLDGIADCSALLLACGAAAFSMLAVLLVMTLTCGAGLAGA